MVGLPLSPSLALNGRVPAFQTLLFSDPRPLVERLGGDFFRQLTEQPGVYLMRDAQDNILYVGKAKNLRKRLNSYRVANPDRLARRHLRLLRAVARIELQECADEAAALAREAELLLQHKPKFNRAGVWPATPRLLIWRRSGPTLEFAIAEIPVAGWELFGPFGGGITHLRAALVRLLWLAQNPAAGSAHLPEGWLHGRLGSIAMLADSQFTEPNSIGAEAILAKLFAGDADGFVAWIGERTQPLVRTYDLALRDADLETVTGFIQAKSRRTRPFTAASQNANEKSADSTLPFLDAVWNPS